ncbi:flagellar biosynthesis protein FlhF [Blastopirellula sp. JC732]|uniref:Flagellar biosynthesis protein FlhF n=1 Tax=Blastopirellula sediminis TaxID=2894196 RepID=A0A9X1MPW1_9BACT|nr:flagellar biosynthesis protein FlhF [Blastopirellula sediminis]MCC9605975.1 flagellar biosynthesis protein FlhF [Blastopirellula sediminis]MCC9630726.1 flagellar biosynthesis protein FlhF [Blastopirellula sediminis]
MDIKTFRAKSMPEALELIRKELGPDAAVLHTRMTPRRGLAGLLGCREFELAASASVPVKSRFQIETAATNNTPTPHEEFVARRFEVELPEAAPAAPIHRPADAEDHSQRLVDGLVDDQGESILDALSSYAGQSLRNYSPIVAQLYDELIAAEVAPQIASQLAAHLEQIAAVSHERDLRQRMHQLIAATFRVGHDLEDSRRGPLRIALVGPTGVGKTTTIAKLAARARFTQKLRVGLITIDTYRIAAVDQLRAYAEIMDLPMQVVSSPSEMRDAVDHLAGCDRIFIDTAGRSPRDSVQLQQLQSVLRAAETDVRYLLLSATTGNRSLQDAERRFASINPTAIIPTKLDEVESLGAMFNLMNRTTLPISYVTNGQDVPHSIAVASAEELAKQLI